MGEKFRTIFNECDVKMFPKINLIRDPSDPHKFYLENNPNISTIILIYISECIYDRFIGESVAGNIMHIIECEANNIFNFLFNSNKIKYNYISMKYEVTTVLSKKLIPEYYKYLLKK